MPRSPPRPSRRGLHVIARALPPLPHTSKSTWANAGDNTMDRVPRRTPDPTTQGSMQGKSPHMQPQMGSPVPIRHAMGDALPRAGPRRPKKEKRE